MMSSLVPGTIFYSPGFNRKSTPTPPDISPAELDNRYQRGDFDGKDWPYDSPVSKSYDVKNTSTKLIILNNKYGQNSTRLRGYYTGPKKSERFIDPCRHRGKSPRNPDFHQMCLDSSTPRFEPDPRTQLDWETGSYAPPQDMLARSSVNPRRHHSCQVTSREPVSGMERPRSTRSSIPPARYFSEFSDLTVGEKLYMWSIEKIYNVDNLKQLKQEQYRTLLKQEVKKGYYRPADYDRYLRYINSASRRKYGTGQNSTSSSRARSAYSFRSRCSSPTKSEARSDNDKDKENDRPKTAAPRTAGPSSDTKKDKDTKKEKDKEPKQQDDNKAAPSPYGKPQSPSRRSTTSARSTSAKSQRSKSGSRASSAKSVQKQTTKDDEDDEEPVHHKEGGDRPKSRLGHKTPEDRDTGSVSSSQVSVKSDRKVEADNQDTGSRGNGNRNRKPSPSPSNNNRSRQTPSMGSRSSMRSRDSFSNVDKKADTKADSKSDSGSSTKGDSQVHRIPSAGYDKRQPVDKRDSKTDDKETPKETSDDKTEEQNESRSAQQETVRDDEEEQRKAVTFNDNDEQKPDVSDTLADKTETPNGERNENVANGDSNVNSTDTKQPATTTGSETKTERRDSLDTSDDDTDRQREKDPDKIEY